MKLEKRSFKGENEIHKINKHEKKKKRKQREELLGNIVEDVKVNAELFCEGDESHARKKSKKKKKHHSADDRHCEQRKDGVMIVNKENCIKRVEESESLPQINNDFDAVGSDEILSLSASKEYKKQNNAKTQERKRPENPDSKGEKVSERGTRIEECGKPVRLMGGQDDTIRNQKPKKKKRKEKNDLEGKIFQQHDNFLKTSVKGCDDSYVNFSDTNPNAISSSIKIEDNQCHDRLLLDQNHTIRNHKHKKKNKKKRSRDLEDQKVESEITQNDWGHNNKKKRQNVDLIILQTDGILENNNVESLNQKMHIEKAKREKIKDTTRTGLSCEDQGSDQVERNVTLLKRNSYIAIDVDPETDFVQKRKKKKRKHQKSNDKKVGLAAGETCASLNTGKLYEKQVNKRENDFGFSPKRIKIECINDSENNEKRNFGSDKVKVRKSESIKVQEQLEGAACNGDYRKVKLERNKSCENKIITSINKAVNDVENDTDQADFIFPNIHGSDEDGSSSSESVGQDNKEEVEHKVDPDIFALIADNDDKSDSLQAREAPDCKGNSMSPKKSSAQPKINKDAIKKKLEGLGHNLQFKWKLKPADIEQLKREGIQFEEGAWTKDEIKILESNMIEFCDTAGISLQDLKDLLMDKSVAGGKTKRELGVYIFLTIGLNRNIRYVYRKLEHIIDPTNYKGKWASAEENMLLELYQKYGCRWLKIGEELGRSQYSVRVKIRTLLNGDICKGFENVTLSIQGPWKMDEEDRLLKAVEELFAKTEEEDGEDSEKRKQICWGAVSACVKTRSAFQCRKKWLDNLSWKKPGQKTKKWASKDRAKFLTLLSKCGEKYDKHVDWVKIGKDLGKPESAEILRNKWIKFKGQVPGYKLLEFQEILDWLMKNKVPRLLGK